MEKVLITYLSMQSITSADNTLHFMKLFRGPEVLHDSFAAHLNLHSVFSVSGHHSMSSKHAAPADVEHYVPEMIEEVKFLLFADDLRRSKGIK